MFKKKILIFILIAVLITGTAVLFQSNKNGNDQNKIADKIYGSKEKGSIILALVLPLQGENSDIGQSALNGAKLATEVVNSEGGILGHKIELVIGDSRSSPNLAAEITRDFVAKGYKIIIGGLNIDESVSILENSKDSNIFYLADGTPLTCLKEDNLKLNNKVWGMGITPQMQTETFLVSLSDKFRQASERDFNMYIYGNNGSESISNYFKDVADGLEFKLVGEDYVDIRIGDLFQRIRKIFDFHPDLLMFTTRDPGTEKFLTHAHKLSLRTEMTVATINSVSQELAQKLGEECDGVWTTTTYSSEINSDLNKKFLENWKNLFKEQSFPTATAIKAYSTITIIKEALLKNGSADINELAKALNDIEVKLPQGSVSVSAENHLLVQPLYLSQIDKGKFSKLELIGDVSHPAFEACSFPEKVKEKKLTVPEDY